MSVTFMPAPETMRLQIACYCGASAANQTFPTRTVAYLALEGNIPFERPAPCAVTDWCSYAPLRVQAVDENRLYVKASNGNAVYLMDVLGLDVSQQEGEMDGQEFLNRVQEKLAELPVVEGERPTVSVGVNPYEGYTQDRLAELAHVGAHAAAHNSTVIWG